MKPLEAFNTALERRTINWLMPMCSVALLYIGSGKNEEALEDLNRAIEHGRREYTRPIHCAGRFYVQLNNIQLRWMTKPGVKNRYLMI
jgi:hypothetical protein